MGPVVSTVADVPSASAQEVEISASPANESSLPAAEEIPVGSPTQEVDLGELPSDYLDMMMTPAPVEETNAAASATDEAQAGEVALTGAEVSAEEVTLAGEAMEEEVDLGELPS